jgi:hypothetical protein
MKFIFESLSTVDKILMLNGNGLWERKRGRTNRSYIRQMPTPVGVWWTFAKKLDRQLGANESSPPIRQSNVHLDQKDS